MDFNMIPLTYVMVRQYLNIHFVLTKKVPLLLKISW